MPPQRLQTKQQMLHQHGFLNQLVRDGDTKHIGFKVEMPGVYEIASSDVTIGRVPEKADLVIPVATVSGVHARIQSKQGSLLVTDLDSTNGTFIDDKRLRPGVVTTVSSGSCITFGDTHLAMFRVSKVEKVKSEDTIQETESGLDNDIKPDNTETN
ncbi:putative zeaxanthin epoxidase [Lupinus albus]|uniref:Putative zeaxanthin epoxidase n=1 Tax=Lupinus albus TaxID=3870 RepID=A0A6A4P128_LUPAL|nr:putative zeaxanthin epoxidase [Lupinus albus]